jgi:hypothetical protein
MLCEPFTGVVNASVHVEVDPWVVGFTVNPSVPRLGVRKEATPEVEEVGAAVVVSEFVNTAYVVAGDAGVVSPPPPFPFDTPVIVTVTTAPLAMASVTGIAK